MRAFDGTTMHDTSQKRAKALLSASVAIEYHRITKVEPNVVDFDDIVMRLYEYANKHTQRYVFSLACGVMMAGDITGMYKVNIRGTLIQKIIVFQTEVIVYIKCVLFGLISPSNKSPIGAMIRGIKLRPNSDLSSYPEYEKCYYILASHRDSEPEYPPGLGVDP